MSPTKKSAKKRRAAISLVDSPSPQKRRTNGSSVQTPGSAASVEVVSPARARTAALQRLKDRAKRAPPPQDKPKVSNQKASAAAWRRMDSEMTEMVRQHRTMSSEAASLACFERGPPPVLLLGTGHPVELGPEGQAAWLSRKGGEVAARRGWTHDCVRLAGTIRLEFEVLHRKKLDKLLKPKSPTPKKPRPTDLRWHGLRGPGPKPQEWWHPASGEVVTPGNILPSVLARRTEDPGTVGMDDVLALLGETKDDQTKAFRCREGQEAQYKALLALVALTRIDPKLYGCPFVRTACFQRNSSTTQNGKGRVVCFDMHVYFHRLLFFLVAHPGLLILMQSFTTRHLILAADLTRLERGPPTIGSRANALPTPHAEASGSRVSGPKAAAATAFNGSAGAASASEPMEIEDGEELEDLPDEKDPGSGSRGTKRLAKMGNRGDSRKSDSDDGDDGADGDDDDVEVVEVDNDSDDDDAGDGFTITTLMKSCEDKGYPAGSQPPGLALTLKPYQRQTLQWMLDMESSHRVPRGLNGFFWQELYFPDDERRAHPLFFSAKLGELRLETPPVIRGGLLCEEMGLGKTLEIVALVQASRLLDHSVLSAGISGPTLIVVPAALQAQWLLELEKYLGVPPTRVSAFALSGSPDARSEGDAVPGSPEPFKYGAFRGGVTKQAIKRVTARLAEMDVVITTYLELKRDHRKILRKVPWKRLCLDEMQEVRGANTQLAKLCEALPGERRWMISGTPLFTGIHDLRGELSFLRVTPFSATYEDGFWDECIGRPWRSRDPAALRRLRTLLSCVMMRHAKSQVYVPSGESIVALPGLEEEEVPITLSPAEDAVYCFVEALSVSALEEDPGADGSLGMVHRSRSGAEVGLRLCSYVATSASLLAGGSGCRTALGDLHELQRVEFNVRQADAAGVAASSLSFDPNEAAAQPEGLTLRKMTPTQATQHLSGRDVQVEASSAHQRRFGDFTRHADATHRVHARSRTYGMVGDAIEQIERVEQKLEQLQRDMRTRTGDRARYRWKWALEQVTTGRGGGADARTQEVPAEDALRMDGPKPDGTWRWLWCCRGMRCLALEEAKVLGASAPPQSRPMRSWLPPPRGWRFDRELVDVMAAKFGSLPLSDALLNTWVHTSVRDLMAWAPERLALPLQCMRFRPNRSWASPREERDMREVYAKAEVLSGGYPEGKRAAVLDKQGKAAAAFLQVQVAAAEAAATEVAMGRDRDEGEAFIKARAQKTMKDVLRGCNRIWTEMMDGIRSQPRVGGAAEYRTRAAELHHAIETHGAEVATLLPLLQKLRFCKSAGLSSKSIESSGIATLIALEDGGTGEETNCPICLSNIDRPVLTPCAHIFCMECIFTWLNGNAILNNAIPQFGGHAGALMAFGRNPMQSMMNHFAGVEQPCPCCRQPLTRSTFIEITHPKPAEERPKEEPAVVEARPPRFDPLATQPEFGRAACPQDFLQMPRPEATIRRMPAWPLLPPSFLSHLAAACAPAQPGAHPSEPRMGAGFTKSAKMRKLVDDLRHWVKIGEGHKAVVFARHRATVLHTQRVLQEEGIKHVLIYSGQAADRQEEAVYSFHHDPDTTVFVLHAGAAAAGLTLSNAHHVVLLEPLRSRSEELQATSRCHRIGVAHRVQVRRYYTRGTVEERLLAWRRQEEARNSGDAEADALAALPRSGNDLQNISQGELRWTLGVPG